VWQLCLYKTLGWAKPKGFETPKKTTAARKTKQNKNQLKA